MPGAVPFGWSAARAATLRLQGGTGGCGSMPVIRGRGWLFLAHSGDHVSVLGDQAVADGQSAASARGCRCAAPAGWIGSARLSALRRAGGYGTD